MVFPVAREYETLESVNRSILAVEPETILAAVKHNGPTGPEACLELPDRARSESQQELWQTKL